MYCPKCGFENKDDEKICIACSQPLPIEADEPPPVAQTSKLAVWSLVLSVMGLFTFMVTALPAIICGIVGLVKIRDSNGRLKGKGLAITGIVLPVVYIFLILPILFAIVLPAMVKERQLAQDQMCAERMQYLSHATRAYIDKYNSYPPADKWYDEYILICDILPYQFCCPLDGEDENFSSYAFNINVAGKKPSEVPPFTVLFFETYPAKNPVGGPELAAPAKHHGYGSMVLYANGRVQFIKKEDLPKLRWEP